MTKRPHLGFAARAKGRQGCVIRRRHTTGKLQTRAQLLDEPLILVAGLATKTMVDVDHGDGERDLLAQQDEESEQRDRVATTRDASQYSIAWGEQAVLTHRPAEDV